MDAQQINNMFALFEAVREGVATEEQYAQLDQMLARDKRLCKCHVEYFSMCVLLRSGKAFEQKHATMPEMSDSICDMRFWRAMAENEITAPRIVIEKPKPKFEPVKVVKPAKVARKVNKFALYSALISAAAMVLLLLYVTYWMPPASQEVATLADSVNARWAFPPAPLQIGVRLKNLTDPLVLSGGAVKVVFDEGAEVIIEGPAEFELSSMGKMVLHSGRAFAVVPREARGFTVQTRSSTIIDLGTEFGVKADLNGTTDVHMFKGKVSLVAGRADKKEEGIALLAGFAKSVKADGRVDDIELRSSIFLGPAQFDTMSQADKEPAYRRWLLYSGQLRNDPSLVAYYTFDNQDESSQMLLNRASSTMGRLDGALGDGKVNRMPTWDTGRWPLKPGLRFNRAQQQHIVVPHDPALMMQNQMSLACWVFLETASSGGHLVSKRVGTPTDNVEYQAAFFGDIRDFSVARSNTLQFISGAYQKNTQSSPSANCYTPPIIWQSGQWHHIAMTFDGAAVTYYLDGAMIASQIHSEAMPQGSSSPLRIGTDRSVGDMASFDGVMDELAIFKRVLSAGEVQQMYQAGKPG